MPENRALSTLHLSTARSWRGGENQLLLLARGLIARGQRALLLAPREAPLHERAREAAVPTRPFRLRGTVDPAGTWRLSKLLREVQPDVLHLHDSHAVLPGQLAARALPAERLCVIAHRRTAFRLRGRWKYQSRVDKVLAISAAVREQVLEAGLAPERVAVVYSGLTFPEPLPKDGPEAARLRAELRLPPGAVLAAHAAALTSEKRQADLIAAWARCAAPSSGNGPRDAPAPALHLAIAGRGALEEDLKARVRAAGLSERVHFLGFKRDLRPLWAAAEMAVFASEAEGLCTALVEAQGAGLPAVVTRAGGMVEVVEEGKSGFVVPVGGVERLANALGRLAADRKLRLRMGEAARTRARRLFSAATMVEATLRVYRSVLAAKRRSRSETAPLR